MGTHIHRLGRSRRIGRREYVVKDPFNAVGRRVNELKRAIGIYYGSCLLSLGLVLGIVLGTSMTGVFLLGKPATIVAIAMASAGIVGVYLDWIDRLKKLMHIKRQCRN